MKKAIGTMLLISALGPYLAAGLRLDHVVILIVAAFVVILKPISTSRIYRQQSSLLWTLFLGAFFILVNDALLGVAVREISYSSGLGRVVLPVFIVMIGNYVVADSRTIKFNAEYYLSLIVWLAGLSGAITIGAIFYEFGWIERYYSAGGAEGVWSQAQSIGRFTGLFNQPLEAGAFYSVALLAALYLLNSRTVKASRSTLILLPILIIGGILSLSKNFLIAGIGAALCLLYMLERGTFYRVISLLFVGVVGLIATILLFIDLESILYLNRLYEMYGETGLISAMTAGRFGGEESDVQQLFIQLFLESPWTGFGIGTQAPLDNGYLEYGYQGGIIAMLLNILFFVFLVTFSLRTIEVDYSKLTIALAIFGIIASIGGPVITANRANLSYLFCICLSVYCARATVAKKFSGEMQMIAAKDNKFTSNREEKYV